MFRDDLSVPSSRVKKIKKKKMQDRRNSCYIGRPMAGAVNGRPVTLDSPARSLGSADGNYGEQSGSATRFVF